jgi:hypothetical protein
MGGFSGGTGMMTHTVVRMSDVAARKFAEKAQRRAHKARQWAREAGALLDDDNVDLLWIDKAALWDGGLVHKTPEQLWVLQSALLPAGSREYNDSRGHPRDSVRVTDADGTERVILPARALDASTQHARLRIGDVMYAACGLAFARTDTLNPMQSATVDMAFHSRENMMVCAPTGGGKTNMAMLSVVAHF